VLLVASESLKVIIRMNIKENREVAFVLMEIEFDHHKTKKIHRSRHVDNFFLYMFIFIFLFLSDPPYKYIFIRRCSVCACYLASLQYLPLPKALEYNEKTLFCYGNKFLLGRMDILYYNILSPLNAFC